MIAQVKWGKGYEMCKNSVFEKSFSTKKVHMNLILNVILIRDIIIEVSEKK